jgi:hypothetical protein
VTRMNERLLLEEPSLDRTIGHIDGKVVFGGQVPADLWKMVIANVRAKREVASDLRAQVVAIPLSSRHPTGWLPKNPANADRS